MNERLRAGYILLLVALLHVLISFFWLRADTRPWIWDMGFHARIGLDYLDVLQHPSSESLAAAYREGRQYPPLFHFLEGLSYMLAGRNADAAAFPNFLFLGLMLWAVFRIGERVGDPDVGLWAAVITSFIPIVAWVSRTPLLDFSLAAMVYVAIHFLYQTENFGLRRESILFGVICGLGMLVKWTFAFFLIGPLLYAYFERPTWRNRVCAINLALAIAVCAAISSVWYLPKLNFLLFTYLPAHSAEGAAEGDPSIFSPITWIFYLQFLLSYQLFIPLAVLLSLGVYLSFKRSSRAPSLAVIWVCVVSSWFILTLLRNKDPRYTLPLLPAIAIIAAAGFGGEDPVKKILKWLTLAVAFVQFAAISFNILPLPDKVSLGTFHRGTYNWEWQVFSRTYAGFLGPAREEEWHIESVLTLIAQNGGGTLYVVPDHAYVSAQTFLYEARLRNLPVEIRSVSSAEVTGAVKDFYLVKTGDQGDLKSAADAERFTGEILRNRKLQLLRAYSLPDGTQALLLASKKLSIV